MNWGSMNSPVAPESSKAETVVLRELLLPFRDMFRVRGKTVRDRVYG